MTLAIAWDLDDWVAALDALPRGGPLPARAAIVPGERFAHALRRACVRSGRAAALAGATLLGPHQAAGAVLDAAGADHRPGEESLRPARLRALLRTDVGMTHFTRALLDATRGWEEAFARTIGEMEGAGLTHEELGRRTADPRGADLARLWKAADDCAGSSWTKARALAEATRILARDPCAWPFDGPVLAGVSIDAPAVEALFARAIPGARLLLQGTRPTRERDLGRLEALLGAAAAGDARAATAPRPSSSERDLLAAHLFEPHVDANRERSQGPDGTVALERHAGVEAEIEAAAEWVGRQILERGVPLEEIAVLVPYQDPLAGMVADRIARLGARGAPRVAVQVAGGRPLSETAAGARSLSVVRALREHLGLRSLGDVLPALRSLSLTRGAALDLASQLGTAGGSAGNPRAALAWEQAVRTREPALQAILERARAAKTDDESAAAAARDERSARRLLADLQAVRPALLDLVGLAREVLDGAALPALWPAIRGFLERWILAPEEAPRVVERLDSTLARACEDTVCSRIAGEDALRLIEETILDARVPGGRFGEPAVYVGTIAGAAGLPFRAVRILGLSEGSVPPVPREDPVLSDALRESLGPLVPTSADRAGRSVRALDRAVRSAAREVALSAPVMGLDGSAREPASLFLEVAAALGRPDGALESGAFAPARESALRARRDAPLSEAARQDLAASGRDGIPAGWRAAPDLDLARIEEITRADAPLSSLDGVLGADCPVDVLPGLTPGKPISASGLALLLECPHRFLLERVLGWKEPAGAASEHELAPHAYGTLFHRAAETFAKAHGAAFSERTSTLEEWNRRAREIARAELEAFLCEVPLTGEPARTQQRERLERELVRFLTRDWDGGRKSRFIGAEIPFGHATPVVIETDAAPLHVRGFIDRIDVAGGRALVRDLKTGKAHPRTGEGEAPTPTIDVQIALYGIVARQLADPWKLPAKTGAAYVYTRSGREGVRAFIADFATLETAARGWLTVAAELLTKRSFPRTPLVDDCTYCAFRPVCGPGANDRAAERLPGAGGALAAFHAARVP